MRTLLLRVTVPVTVPDNDPSHDQTARDVVEQILGRYFPQVRVEVPPCPLDQIGELYGDVRRAAAGDFARGRADQCE